MAHDLSFCVLATGRAKTPEIARRLPFGDRLKANEEMRGRGGSQSDFFYLQCILLRFKLLYYSVSRE